jgi:GTPase SAR1 family protein
MSKLNNIRKLYVIGDSEVGKTTSIDVLVRKTKMVSNSSIMFFELDDQVLGE